MASCENQVKKVGGPPLPQDDDHPARTAPFRQDARRKKESPMLEPAGTHAFQYKLHEGSPLQMQWLFYGHSNLPVAVQTWELPPGGFEGMHSHGEPDRPLEEMYVITEGTGQMTVEDETYSVTVGDAVLAKVGARHDLRNTGKGPLKVLVIWGEPRPADYSDFGSAKMAGIARTGSSSDFSADG